MDTEKLAAEKLANVLRLHAKWLRNEPEGMQANLHGANLSEANLRGANLRGAILSWVDSVADFSRESTP